MLDYFTEKLNIFRNVIVIAWNKLLLNKENVVEKYSSSLNSFEQYSFF